MPEKHLLTLQVQERPASYATAHEERWKTAVRRAIDRAEVKLDDAELRRTRFAVTVTFRTPPPKNANEVWDLDNLIKPTLDAMEGIFGLRQSKGKPQAADDRVDRINASKHTVDANEEPGATIEIFIIEKFFG